MTSLRAAFLIACALPAAACRTAPEPGLLNSERIERRFGSFGIEVLATEPVRVSNLYSSHGARTVCRTFAVVQFAALLDAELAAPLAQVRAGAPLGATLQEAGFTVIKRHRFVGAVAAGPRFRELAHLGSGHAMAAIHVYDLSARRDAIDVPVATIAEVHHPDYLDLAQLRVLVGEDLDSAPGVVSLETMLFRTRREMAVPTSRT